MYQDARPLFLFVAKVSPERCARSNILKLLNFLVARPLLYGR
jgi:hypothetical protein